MTSHKCTTTTSSLYHIPTVHPSEKDAPILLFHWIFLNEWSLHDQSCRLSVSVVCCSWNRPKWVLKCRTRVWVFSFNLCSEGLQGFFYTFLWYIRSEGNGRQHRFFWIHGLKSHRKWSFMVQWTILKTKTNYELISSKNFLCLLMEKVCVDSGSITQKYASLLISENHIALQRNLAALRKMWIKVRRQTTNEVSLGLIFLEASQCLMALTITGNIWNKFCQIIALVYLIHYFPFTWLWCAAFGYDANSTCKRRRGNNPPDTIWDIFPTVTSSKSTPRFRSSFWLKGLSVLFCTVQSPVTGLRALCFSATNWKGKAVFCNHDIPCYLPQVMSSSRLLQGDTYILSVAPCCTISSFFLEDTIKDLCLKDYDVVSI